MNEILDAKRQLFTKDIRRKHKVQMIIQSRKRFLEAIEVQQHQEENNQRARASKNAVKDIAIALRGEPCAEWKQQIDLLQKDAPYFEIEDLIETCVLSQLTLVFKPEFKHLGLCSMTARLLSQMVCTSKTSSSSPARMLVEYGIVELLLVGMYNNSNVQDIMNQLHLIGNMMSQNGYIRNKIVKAGWIPILLALINAPNMPDSLLGTLVWLVVNTIHVFQQPEHNLKYSLSQIFGQVLIRILEDSTNSEIKRDCLFGVYQLTLEGQNRMKNLVCRKGFLDTVIGHLSMPGRVYTYIVWQIIFELSGTSAQAIVTEMLKKGLLQLAWAELEQFPEGQNYHLVLKTLYNVAINNAGDADMILRSELLSTIIEGFVKNSNLKKKILGLHVIDGVLQCINYSQAEYLLTVYDVLHLAAFNVLNNDSESTQVYICCLRILTALIIIYDKIYTPNGPNKMITRLEGEYQFSTALWNLSQNNRNARVVKAVVSLYDKIAENYTSSDF